MRATSLNSPDCSILSNFPDGWFDRYFKEGMQKDDPVVRYCFENSSPVCWEDLLKLEQYITPVGIKIMEEAASIGIRVGLSIPLKAPSGEIAIFSLASKNASLSKDDLLSVLPQAQNFSTQVLDSLIKMRLQSSENNASQSRLTEREKECLFWACEGKTAWEISKILDVSERTVIFHLTGATKKLGATNRQHAVAKALMLGWVKPVHLELITFYFISI